MFIKNKYKRWYYHIIDKARKRGIPDTYYEKHHITPRSLGGTDDWWNIIDLTFRIHFLVNWLLTKMNKGNKRKSMLYALFAMSNFCCPKYNTSWRYEKSRLAGLEARIGYRHSDETRFKIADSNKVSWTVERKALFSEKCKGRKHTEASKLKIAQSRKGKKWTEKDRVARVNFKGKKWTEEIRARYISSIHDRRKLASGHADWRKCHFCQEYDDPKNLFIRKDVCWHKECRNKREKERYQARKSSYMKAWNAKMKNLPLEMSEAHGTQ